MIGIALSGGGVRAALFSLGVMIALIETGCNRRVRCVTSVSGGSILNAALAHSPSLASYDTVAEFEPLAKKFAASLAWRGIFAFDWRTAAGAVWYFVRNAPSAILSVIMLLWIFGLIFENALPEHRFSLTDINYDWLPGRVLIWTVLASFLVTLLVSIIVKRGLFQEAKYASVLQAVTGSVGRLFVKDWGKAFAADGPSVMHVLVATDLLSGEPIFFSNSFVHCRPYGWSHPGEIRTTEALYSSAAFPAVFPPKKLATNRLEFQNGDMPGKLPRVLQLADGGIYNNLGYDWFNILKKHSEDPPSELWPFGELEVKQQKIEISNIIIVNAGAPSSKVSWIGPSPLARIMSVLYDNTVRPRVDLILGSNRPLIDIYESPLSFASRLASSPVDGNRRANDIIAKFKSRGDEFWADFSRDTAGTRTKLSSVGSRPAARLMLHGYLSCLVLLHAKFEGDLPKKIRGEDYFLNLVTEPSKAASAAAPGATVGSGDR